MATTVADLQSPISRMSEGRWLYTRRWDLIFISLSVVLVTVPYLTWLFMRDVLQIESDAGRQAVNLAIAVLIGGPHMYTTFTRTAFDKSYRSKHRAIIASSLLIPLIVVTLALSNLPLLLTIFFFWASIHVLHQIVYVVESYNQKARTAPAKTSLTPLSKAIDFAVVLTALYPLAAYRIAITQDFTIGPTALNDVIPNIFEQPWVVVLAFLVFGVSLVAFIGKTVKEFREGTAHVPKVVFISVTVGASFIVPAMGNLDTAFQGMNVWHSFQYLALTWYANRLREQRGELDRQPFLKSISEQGHARQYYGFNLLMTFGAGILIAISFMVLYFLLGGKWAEPSYALETSYYIGVLSILWIHYYHDHFLFTETNSMVA
jgi:hypothetical protein